MNRRNFFGELTRRNLCRTALAYALVGICTSAHCQNGATIDETAHVLAGLPVKGRLESLTQTSAWQGHAAAIDKAWTTKEFFQLGPITSWMSSHAGEYYNSSDT